MKTGLLTACVQLLVALGSAGRIPDIQIVLETHRTQDQEAAEPTGHFPSLLSNPELSRKSTECPPSTSLALVSRLQLACYERLGDSLRRYP